LVKGLSGSNFLLSSGWAWSTGIPEDSLLFCKSDNSLPEREMELKALKRNQMSHFTKDPAGRYTLQPLKRISRTLVLNDTKVKKRKKQFTSLNSNR